MKTIKWILLAVALIAAAFFAGRFWPHPDPGSLTGPSSAITVTASPGPKQTPIVVYVTGHGSTVQQTPTPTGTSGPVSSMEPIPTPEIVQSKAFTGEITAKFVNDKTGEELGSEVKQLTGTIEMFGSPDDLNANLDFNSEIVFGYSPPEPITLNYHLDIYGGLGVGGVNLVNPIIGIRYQDRLWWRTYWSLGGEWQYQNGLWNGQYRALVHVPVWKY